jgi:uncharacterized membrane protein YkoI
MSKVFSIRMRRGWTASIAVLLTASSIAVWTLFWNPVASSAGIDSGPAAAKLEELHRRAMERTQGETDDEDALTSPSSSGHLIMPEQAAGLAQAVARGRGDTSSPTYIELQTRNGRPVYAVRFGEANWVYMDANTGAAVN